MKFNVDVLDYFLEISIKIVNEPPSGLLVSQLRLGHPNTVALGRGTNGAVCQYESTERRTFRTRAVPDL